MSGGPQRAKPEPLQEIDEELQFHFRTTIEDLVARGATPEEATAEARRRFGDRDGWRLKIAALSTTRPGLPARAIRAAGAIGRDVRDGWRGLRRQPGLAAMTVLTLAIGLGGTAAMFAAVNAAFLKPLPFPDERTLVKIYQGGATRSDIRIALGVLHDWHRDSRSCAAIGGYLSGLTANVSGGDDALRARVSRVTRPLFSAIGVAPARGRLWSDDESAAGAAPAIVISHRLWQRAFAGRPDVLHHSLTIDAAPIPIIGVMPEGFTFPDDTDIWAAVEREGPGAYGSRTAHNFTAVARVAPGATVESVGRELTALTELQKQRFTEMAPENLRVVVVPLRTDLVGAHAGMVWIGLGAVIGLLLVACVNVANLMLTRSLSRETETGIRVALGASRAAIGRAVLVEGLMLATGGAAVGIVFALWVLGGITALTPDAVTGGEPLTLDLRVLLLTALATAGAGLLSASLPAVRAARIDPRQSLADAGRSLATSPRRALNVLVGVEVALAFVLLFGAVVLTESHARLDGVDSGFRQRDLVLGRVSLGLLPSSPYATPAARRTFFERLEAAVAASPGIKGAGLAAIMPPGFSPNGRFIIEGSRQEPSGAHFRLVGGDYFRVMGIPLRRGRLFTADDSAARPQAAIINESLARASFANVDPIGQIVSMPGMDGGDGVATIVGIVGDVRHRGPSLPPVPEAYFHYRQRPWRTYSMTLVVDSAIGATPTAALIRSQVRALDPLIAPEISSMAAEMAPFVAPSAFRAKLLLIVAAIALTLALVGIAGVVSHVAAKRRREMGIRAALGARPTSLTRLVVASGMRPVIAGAICGLIAALAAAEVLSALTFGISTRDPRALGAAAVAILVTGLVASWWPSRRSSKIDPASVLREYRQASVTRRSSSQPCVQRSRLYRCHHGGNMSGRARFQGWAIDLRYVWRVLAASPVFAAVAILSLAIGIGANTVLFSVARFALLDPLPVEDPDELRIVQWSGPAKIEVSQYNSGGSTDPATGRAIRTNYTYQAARQLEARPQTAELFAFNFVSQLTVVVEGRPALAAGGLMASGRYFPVLRPPMALGRGLGPADDDPAAPPAAVLSHAFWLRAFGGDAGAIGAAIAINGHPFSVVGVTAPAFRGLSTGSRFAPLTDVTVPIAMQPLVFAPEGKPMFGAENRLWLRLMARVPRGADDTIVTRELTASVRDAFAAAPFLPAGTLTGLDAVVMPGARGLDSVGRAAATPLAILAAVVGVVLLIACVNLAGLSLARGAVRQRELAVRRALGASRGRLIRQLLLESLAIATAGGLAGVLLAALAFPIVSAMVTSGFDAPSVTLPLDWRTLAMTAGVASVAGLLFGLVPAIGLTRPERTTYLRQRAGGGVSPKLTLGRALLALQIGISVPLVVVAGLLLTTINNLTSIDLGFNADGLIVFRLDPAQDRAAAADIPRFTRDLVARVEGVPGVASVTLVENALVSGWVSNNNILVDGERKSIHMNAVGPRYFETMQIPLRAGRAPTLDDTKTTPQVGVVNETAARTLFGTPSPIGRRFRMGSRDIEIVGVVADSKYSGLRTDVVPTLFDPFLQRGAGGAMHVVVRARGSLAGLEPVLRRAVADVNPNVPISELRTQAEQVNVSMGRERLVARLMTAFSGFALVLACIGLYGATSYAVSRRTSEIGVRIALGAQRSQVLWLVLRQVLVLAIAGLAIGIPVALATGPLVGSLLYGLGPRDPATVAAASAAMIAVALGAGFIPARRAATMTAVAALRQE